MYKEYSRGTIEVITGPMFAGKSDELIKRIKLLGFAGINTLVIKPSIDNRWEKEKIMSRTGASIDTLSCRTPKDVQDAWEPKYEAVAIDEAQFFSKDLVKVIEGLTHKGVRVIVSALDQDFEGNTFGWIGELLAKAEMIEKLTGVCMSCGKAGTMSFRKGMSTKKVEVGNHEYEVRCRTCHAKGTVEKQVIKMEL